MSRSLRILALNPHHGGSHRAFLGGWIEHSQHHFDVLTLPPYKWKWRMRHAPVTFSRELRERLFNRKPEACASPRTPQAHASGLRLNEDVGVAPCEWDVLFCTDMLNLAEFLGLCPPAVRDLPRIVYFHENQLTYPNREDRERDLHFAFSNITTGLAADQVWFNSAFHRDEFLTAVDEWMRRMPDYQLLDAADAIRGKSSVQPPGLPLLPGEGLRLRDPSIPIRIVWVSRWEHDKDPDTFFAALRELKDRGEHFRLNVLGESFGDVPAVFEDARLEFAQQIDHWGYATSREEYQAVLANSDVVVSTAKHEFFGIGVLEAVTSGCFPLVPRALAYPEVLGDHSDFFHDGTATGIADRLCELFQRLSQTGTCWSNDEARSRIMERHRWSSRAEAMDREVELA
ncbi:MAG: glycosyl transferase family 1 [Planctomycetaceae bacterium]|nr:glycosyl transferase family 1 [Planctomycetaceae bacterium]